VTAPAPYGVFGADEGLMNYHDSGQFGLRPNRNRADFFIVISAAVTAIIPLMAYSNNFP
jgi:hypothetical protein